MQAQQQELSFIEQANAVILCYGNINPDELSDEAWARHYRNICWLKEQEARANRRSV